MIYFHILQASLPILLSELLLSSRPRRTHGSNSLDLLERIPELVILTHPMLPSLLGDLVFYNHLFAHVSHEALDESWVPEFGCHAQVLAAAHQGVGLAAFGGGGDAVRVEVGLFAAGYADQTV